jgi:hypothetical protein
MARSRKSQETESPGFERSRGKDDMKPGRHIRYLQSVIRNSHFAFGTRREFFNKMLAFGGLATFTPFGKESSGRGKDFFPKITDSPQTKRLTSGPLLDWFYVHAGYVNYKSGFAERWDVPEGIEIAVQPAEKSEPLILPDRPWERQGIGYTSGTYFRDGKYTCTTSLTWVFIARRGGDGFHGPSLTWVIEFEG